MARTGYTSARSLFLRRDLIGQNWPRHPVLAPFQAGAPDPDGYLPTPGRLPVFNHTVHPPHLATDGPVVGVLS